MPFKGDNPLGTAGGLDLYNAPQFPRIYAVADGPMYILVMRLNGDLYERNRENVEDVIRVIGLRGENLAGFIVRHTGGVVESSATDLDFDAGFSVGQIAPGVVVINIGNNAIVTGMLAADLITNGQLADNAVQRENILDGEIITSKFAAGAVDSTALGNLAVTLAKLAGNSVDSSKIVDDSIVNADINSAAAIAFSKLEAVPGLVKTTTQTFNAVTSVSLNNAFSAAYDNYRIILNISNKSANANILMRARASGVDYTATNYRRSTNLTATTVATTSATASMAGAEIVLSGFLPVAGLSGLATIDIIQPFQAATTKLIHIMQGMNTTPQVTMEIGGTQINVADVFDGFTIFPSTGNISGKVDVYGYN